MNVEKYKCDICKYEFVHEKTRDEHVKRGNCKKFYDDDSLNHHCKICGRGFSQVRSYKRHGGISQSCFFGRDKLDFEYCTRYMYYF